MHLYATRGPEERGDLCTGIYVRAKRNDRWGSHDIADLDTVSLLRWLRSHGGANAWAESVVCLLLHHNEGDIDAAQRDVNVAKYIEEKTNHGS